MRLHNIGGSQSMWPLCMPFKLPSVCHWLVWAVNTITLEAYTYGRISALIHYFTIMTKIPPMRTPTLCDQNVYIKSPEDFQSEIHSYPGTLKPGGHLPLQTVDGHHGPSATTLHQHTCAHVSSAVHQQPASPDLLTLKKFWSTLTPCLSRDCWDICNIMYEMH